MNNNIKSDLNKIIKRNYDPYISKNIMKLQELYSDEQLLFMLSQGTGLKLNENITLYYQGSLGYKCINNNNSVVGTLPVCVQIERTLNNKGDIEVR